MRIAIMKSHQASTVGISAQLQAQSPYQNYRDYSKRKIDLIEQRMNAKEEFRFSEGISNFAGALTWLKKISQQDRTDLDYQNIAFIEVCMAEFYLWEGVQLTEAEDLEEKEKEGHSCKELRSSFVIFHLEQAIAACEATSAVLKGRQKIGVSLAGILKRCEGFFGEGLYVDEALAQLWSAVTAIPPVGESKEEKSAEEVVPAAEVVQAAEEIVQADDLPSKENDEPLIGRRPSSLNKL
jgi:hypothetical protein